MSWKIRRPAEAPETFRHRPDGDGGGWGTRPRPSLTPVPVDMDAQAAADALLQRAQRSTLVTLEAAMAKAMPHRPGQPRWGDHHDRADAVDAAYDLMTLSRLALRSADHLNTVAGALIGLGPRAPGTGH